MKVSFICMLGGGSSFLLFWRKEYDLGQLQSICVSTRFSSLSKRLNVSWEVFSLALHCLTFCPGAGHIVLLWRSWEPCAAALPYKRAVPSPWLRCTAGCRTDVHTYGVTLQMSTPSYGWCGRQPSILMYPLLACVHFFSHSLKYVLPEWRTCDILEQNSGVGWGAGTIYLAYSCLSGLVGKPWEKEGWEITCWPNKLFSWYRLATGAVAVWQKGG